MQKCSTLSAGLLSSLYVKWLFTSTGNPGNPGILEYLVDPGHGTINLSVNPWTLDLVLRVDFWFNLGRHKDFRDV